MAEHHAYQHATALEDETILSRLPRLLRAALRRKGLFPWVIAAVGLLLGYHYFVQQQQGSHRANLLAMFTSAREQLASPHAAIRANAVRTLRELAFKEVIVEPTSPSLESFLVSFIWEQQTEYPLYVQCRTLFHEYAMQERMPNEMQNNVVSSALLESGLDWLSTERRLGIRVGASATGSLLFKAKLSRARGIKLMCDGINFGSADLRLANLSNSSLRGCGLQGAALGGSILNGCDLVEAVLSETDAENADFSFAKCQGTFFTGANLKMAIFTQTNLSDATFKDATLDAAVFSQAYLTNTNFQNSSLREAVFSQTDVSTADFAGADLDGADFTAAIGVSKVGWDSAVNAEKALFGTTRP